MQCSYSAESQHRYGSRKILFQFLLTIFLLATFNLKAQVTTATLNGTVTDPTGAVIANATVTLTSESTSAPRTTQSNGAGVFSFSAVPTGDYDISITASGFGAYSQKGIHLDPGDQRSVRDIKLQPGASNQEVTVTATSGAISLDSGEQSSLISAQDIQHLSVEGRDVTELFKILPGFGIARGNNSVDNATYDPSQVSVNGALGSYAANGTPLNGVSLLSDGADITDPGNFGAAIQNINYEQVAEVKVQTSSFTADTARGPVVVNAVGRSGGDHFHGSLYTYARTSELNSTDWLAKYTGQQKPPDRQVYPGFTFGGPVYVPKLRFNSDKRLTFFVGAEDYAQRNNYAYGGAGGAVLSALVPTAGMRNGDFSPAQLQQYLGPNYQPTNAAGTACSGSYSNICTVPVTGPQGQPIVNGNIAPYVDPGARALINLLPLPNTPSNGTYNYITTNLIDNNLWQARGRIDYAINSNNRFFAVYSTERGKSGIPQVEYYSPRGNLGGINTPGGGLLSTINSELGSFNLSTVFSPTLTNELYGEASWLLQNFVAKNQSALNAGGAYPYQGIFNNGTQVVPQFQDYGNNGLPIALFPDTTNGGIFARKWVRGGGDNLTKVLGPHTIRVGAFVQLDTNHQVLPFVNTNGAISLYYFGETFTDPVAGLVHNTGPVGSGQGGNYLANFMEGHVQTFSQTNIAPAPNLYFWNVDWYAQDHWRVTPRVSLDLGVRFEHLAPWNDAHGQGVPVWQPQTYSAGATTLPGFRWHGIDPSVPNAGLKTRWAYVEPRLGLAWDTYGNGRTVVRAGAGIYRAHDSFNDATNGVGVVEGQRSATVNNILLSSIASQGQAVSGGSSFSPDSDGYGFSPNDDKQPQVYTWNLAIDQRAPFNSVIEIAYVGNHSNDILDNGANQNTNLDDVNKLPIGALFGPNPTTGVTVPVFAPAGVSGSNTSVGTLDTHTIDQYRPYPLYRRILVAQHRLYSNYNGLQTSWTKQQGKAIYGVNYTWSRALGILGGYNNGLPADPFVLRHNYLPETYDHTHIFNASYTYTFGQLIKQRFVGWAANGWELSGITNIQSGADLQSIYNPDFGLSGTLTNGAGQLGINNQTLLGTPDVTLQPVLTCNPAAHTGSHQYVNGNCFALPSTLGQNGTYRFPYIHGPAFTQSDLTASKSFQFKESRSVQFRFAAFNFLNHANSSFTSNYPTQINLNFTNNAPDATLANSRNQNADFGFARLREGRRTVEMSLKVNF